MNLGYIIDLLFSNSLFIILIWVVIGGGTSLMIGWGIKKAPKERRFFLIAVSITLPLLLTLAMIFGSFGLISKVTAMDIVNSQLVVIDQKEGEDSISYRLYVIEPEQGKKINRSKISFDDYISSVENRIFYRDGNTIFVHDIEKNRVIRKIDKKYLSSKFEPLRLGINTITTPDPSSRQFTKTVAIDAKNGKRYYYYPATDYLSQEADKGKMIPGTYYCRGTDLIFINEDRRDSYKMQLKGLTDSYRVKKLEYGYDQKVPDLPLLPDEFLDGEFIQVYPELQTVIILSYETTDKDNYSLTAVDFNMKKLWQIDQKAVFQKKWFEKKPRFDQSIRWGQKLIFNSGSWFYAVDVPSGKILWSREF